MSSSSYFSLTPEERNSRQMNVASQIFGRNNPRVPQNRSVMDVASQMFRPDAPPAGRGTVGPGYPTGKALPRPINRMPPRMPPGLPPRRFFPGGPGRPPSGPFGQGPTRRIPPALDPSRGRAGMDRILDRLRGTRNPMDRMSPSRSRPPIPIDFVPSNLPGGSYQNPPKPPRYEELPYSMPREQTASLLGGSYQMPTQPPVREESMLRGPMRMQDGGEVNPLDAMYAQIGVEDENTAREVIEKILSGQSADLSEAQQGLLGGGVYRRIANRLGMRDRAGNLITPISAVETGYGKTATPDSQKALRNLLDMEQTESGTGIEMLLNYMQNRRRPGEPAEGQDPEVTGPFVLVDIYSGGPQFPGPGTGSPQGSLYPKPPVFGEVSMPSVQQSPFLPYAGMANPMNPNIFGGYGYGFGPSMGMAPMNYYGGFQPPPEQSNEGAE